MYVRICSLLHLITCICMYKYGASNTTILLAVVLLYGTMYMYVRKRKSFL